MLTVIGKILRMRKSSIFEGTKSRGDNQNLHFAFPPIQTYIIAAASHTGEKSLFRAFAKINIGLRITGRRDDGFHEIETVFHRINLYDEIAFLPGECVTVESNDPAAPGGESNICHRAASILRDHLKKREGIHITVRKQIPVGAGLGGGSADAALVLRELPAQWNGTINDETLITFALKLGSDVPYFLHDGSAHALGRGEVLRYFPLRVPYAILVCTPPVTVSTRWAYQQIGSTSGSRPDLRELVEEGMKDPEILRRQVGNDFETPIFRAYPIIRETKEVLERLGAVFASLSGSGSSVYGLFRDEKESEKASEQLRSNGCKTFHTPPHFEI
jgi:4-diphosphocytidyl-2-C-methyl-D-erythritol kinase